MYLVVPACFRSLIMVNEKIRAIFVNCVLWQKTPRDRRRILQATPGFFLLTNTLDFWEIVFEPKTVPVCSCHVWVCSKKAITTINNRSCTQDHCVIIEMESAQPIHQPMAANLHPILTTGLPCLLPGVQDHWFRKDILNYSNTSCCMANISNMENK